MRKLRRNIFGPCESFGFSDGDWLPLLILFGLTRGCLLTFMLTDITSFLFLLRLQLPCYSWLSQLCFSVAFYSTMSSSAVVTDVVQLPAYRAPGDLPPSSQHAWRKACSRFGISHSVKVNGKTHELTMETLRKVYTDKYKHWQANNTLAEIHASYGASGDGGVAFIFWHSDSLEIPIQLLKAVESLVRNGGFFNVFLISFLKLTNVPVGIKLVFAVGT